MERELLMDLKQELALAIREQDRAHKAESNITCSETRYVARQADDRVENLRKLIKWRSR